MTPRLLSGVRVLEVAAWTYVPMAGGVLAEWGADVIKIEHPEYGDPQRGLVTSGRYPDRDGVNFIIEHPNRGKRSVGLDVASEDGRDLLLQLVATCDVFLTSFLPDARRRLHIDVDDIRAVNPDIVYVRGSANGPRGPEARRGGYDACTFWSRGGSADVTYQEGMDYPQNQPGGAFGDTLGGSILAGGVVAALLHRDRTGEAVVVDSSLLAVGAWAAAFSIAGCAAWGIDRFPYTPRGRGFNPLSGSYRTADGRFLTLVMLQSDRYWGELVRAMGAPELVDDPRFVDGNARGEHRSECVQLLDELFARRTLEEWKEILAEIEGVWSAVQTPGEVVNDPQVVANGYVRDVVAEDGSTFKLVATPVQFDEQAADVRRAPNHGEHTDEVLLDLGLGLDRLLELKIKGTVH
jgi:crotonobetainyl-CoA:carnitine CoA-transferase CaiB-like acyl-CoA transferase